MQHELFIWCWRTSARLCNMQHELFIWCWRTLAKLCNTSCLSSAGEPQQGYATCNTSCISGVGELQQSCATRAVYPVLENLSKAVQHELLSCAGESQQGCATRAVILCWRTSARLCNMQHELFILWWRTSARLCNTSCSSGAGERQQDRLELRTHAVSK